MSETFDTSKGQMGTGIGLSVSAQNDEVEYHPLALDSDAPGFWGRIDRVGESISAWLNPILIKEARQSLKSKQFLITFFLLLAASCLWTIMGIVFNAPDVYYIPTGSNLLMGYYLILAVPMLGMVPLAAHRSLAAEIDDDTFEMLILTRLSSTGIVMGKLNSAMLQMLVYFAAIVPCLAFTYLLRGVTLQTIGMVIVVTFFTAILVTSFSLMLATLAFSRAGQTIALLITLVVIVGSGFFCTMLCAEGFIFSRGYTKLADQYLGISSFVLVGVSFVVIFIQAAAARIAPVTENRSTGLRRTMFAQQLVWIGVMIALCLWSKELEIANVAGAFLTGYWLVMGSLMLCESPELSPRVQRDLPSTFAGRALLTWFNPGPATGYVFAVATGVVGLLGMGVFGVVVSVDGGRAPRTNPLIFSGVASGYLMLFMSITRMIAEPIMKRTGRIIPVALGSLFGVLILALFTPSIFKVLTTGTMGYGYQTIDVINWGYTLGEMIDGSFDPALGFLIMAAGAVAMLINLAMLFRVFEYRKVTVPERVMQDMAN